MMTPLNAMTVTANQLSGRAIGAMFFSGFGGLWIGLALYVREQLHVGTGALVAGILLVLTLGCGLLLRLAKQWPTVPEDAAMKKAFHRVNLAQWVMAAMVAFSFAQLHLDAYVLSAITAIVGLHLLPLAKIFRYPLHYVTGAALVAWAVVSALTVPVEHLQGTTAMGTGIILWLSAACTLVVSFELARRAGSTTPAGA